MCCRRSATRTAGCSCPVWYGEPLRPHWRRGEPPRRLLDSLTTLLRWSPAQGGTTRGHQGSKTLGCIPITSSHPQRGEGNLPRRCWCCSPSLGTTSLESHSYPLVLSAALPAPQSQKCPAQPFRSPADILEISGQGRKGVITSFPIGWNNELPCRQARAPCPNIHTRSQVEKSPCQSVQHSLTVHFPHC